MDNQQNRRRYYRLRYPLPERPTLRCRDCNYRILEVSEGGIKVQFDPKHDLVEGQEFAGLIRFKDEGTAAVAGVVLRTDEREIAVQLAKGIDFKRMMIEQRRIRQKYPMFFDRHRD